MAQRHPGEPGSFEGKLTRSRYPAQSLKYKSKALIDCKANEKLGEAQESRAATCLVFLCRQQRKALELGQRAFSDAATRAYSLKA